MRLCFGEVLKDGGEEGNRGARLGLIWSGCGPRPAVRALEEPAYGAQEGGRADGGLLLTCCRGQESPLGSPANQARGSGEESQPEPRG